MSSLASVTAKSATPHQTHETVAVVVIHGVGETYEGWIDNDFVPRLEASLAYQGLEIDYDPKFIRKEIDKPSLVFPVQCGGDEGDAKDGYISISLEDDDDFNAFCQCVGLDPNANDGAFADRDGRYKNQIELNNTIWKIIYDQKKNWTSEALLKALRAARVPAAYAFSAESEVNRVRDPGKTGDPSATWKSFTRTQYTPDRKVIVTEMFWADLSYGGGIILQRLLSMIELFLEAPFVLGRAFVGDSKGFLDVIIQKLVNAANWVMRWPLAGLNAAIFACCFTAVLLSQFGRLDLLPLGVIVTLLAVAHVGRKAMLAWRDEKPGLSDLGLASMVFALLLAAWVAAYCVSTGEFLAFQPQEAAVTYLNISVRIILGFWFLWSALNVAAVIIVSLVAVVRYVVWLAQRLFNKAEAQNRWDANILLLARPGAAIGLGVLVGIVWKLVLAVLGLLIIAVLAEFGGKTIASCSPPDLSIAGIVFNAAGYNADNVCQLVFANQHLANVLVVNSIAALGVALALFFVVGWRRALMEIWNKEAENGTLVIPRLIAHPVLIAMLFAVSFIGFMVFYVMPLIGGEKPESLIGLGIGFVMPSAVGLALFALVMALVAEFSSNIIHIGRDLVDHQYYRNETTLPSKLHARVANRASKAPGSKTVGVQLPPSRRYLRRMRIQKRLEALIEDVIQYQHADRVVFFAHSQGTVILHDYLLNTDNVFDDADLPGRKALNDMTIDVLTIGSPLKHIYRYYYNGYDGPQELLAKSNMVHVRSWTNMWRVDDPIGQDVHEMPNIKEGDIVNIGIAPGGHTDYWKEGQVHKALWSLVENRRPEARKQQTSMVEALSINQMPPLFDSKQV